MVVAVGESGLDYFRTADPGREAQKESFRAHIDMAQRVGLPLQIHDRDAHEDTLAILDECASVDQRIVFHCYSGDAEMARRLAKRGWYASFAGPITTPRTPTCAQLSRSCRASLSSWRPTPPI